MSRALAALITPLLLAACVGGGGSTGAVRGAPVVAGDACRDAIAASVQRPAADVVIYQSRALASGLEKTATVAGTTRRWACQLGPEGAVLAVRPADQPGPG